MEQQLFNQEVDKWVKEFNNRLNFLEAQNKQIEIISDNQECDMETIHSLIDKVNELDEEVRHIRKLQALIVDLTRFAMKNR